MEIAGLVVAVVAALAAIAGAIFAGVQAAAARGERKDAEEARDESRSARDEAARLAREANEAFVRQAEAQKRANELAEAAMPKPEIAWTIRQLSKSRYEAVNTGDLGARNVNVVPAGDDPDLLQVDEDEKLPRDVPPGDGIAFYAVHVAGPDPKLRLEWEDPDGQKFHAERTIR